MPPTSARACRHSVSRHCTAQAISEHEQEIAGFQKRLKEMQCECDLIGDQRQVLVPRPCDALICGSPQGCSIGIALAFPPEVGSMQNNIQHACNSPNAPNTTSWLVFNQALQPKLDAYFEYIALKRKTVLAKARSPIYLSII